MNTSNLNIRVSKSGWGGFMGLNMYGCQMNGDKILGVVSNIELQTREDDCYEPDPMCKLNPNAAQVLMDDLWDCGVRPSEGTGSAGSFAAQGKHLDDMRKLVFALGA